MTGSRMDSETEGAIASHDFESAWSDLGTVRLPLPVLYASRRWKVAMDMCLLLFRPQTSERMQAPDTVPRDPSGLLTLCNNGIDGNLKRVCWLQAEVSLTHRCSVPEQPPDRSCTCKQIRRLLRCAMATCSKRASVKSNQACSVFSSLITRQYDGIFLLLVTPSYVFRI